MLTKGCRVLYDVAVGSAVATLSATLEPVLITGVGVLVGAIVLSLFVPAVFCHIADSLMVTEEVRTREAAVGNYRYLCQRGARKFRRPGLDARDLEQVAAIGLIKACDRYDARSRTPFEAYAWLLIVGELMHYVRDHEYLVRLPRWMKRVEKECSAAQECLLVSLEREPSDAEVAAYLGTPRQLIDQLRIGRETVRPSVSLDAVGEAACARGSGWLCADVCVEGWMQIKSALAEVDAD